ncbi:MAG: tetratricopeptide repeat protein [Myxococcota bacterium]
MPGHIFLQTGDYELAAKTNVAASEADRAYVERTGASGMYPLMYWTHNIISSPTHACSRALRRSDRGGTRMVSNVGSAVSDMQMLEGLRDMSALGPARLPRGGRGAGRRAAGGPGARAGILAPCAGRGAGDPRRARLAEQERTAFAAAVAAVPAEDRFLINNSAADFLAIAKLRCSMPRSRQPAARAIGLWAKAAERQEMLQYDEPPPWYEPVARRQGFALLRAGRHAEAEAVFRQALAERPRDGRLLFGLAETLRAQGREGDAKLRRGRLARVWDPSARALRTGDL